MLTACASADPARVTQSPNPYEVRLPSKYEARSGERFPLILFLHGSGGLTAADHLIPHWAEAARSRSERSANGRSV